MQIGEIKALAGVDFLTISPALLEELKNSTAPVPKKPSATTGTPTSQALSDAFFLNQFFSAAQEPLEKVTFVDNEPEFRWTLLQDQMAFDKLHEGIKKFAEDGETLKEVLRKKLSA